MAIDRKDPKIRGREGMWSKEVTKQLPTLLTKLLKPKVYGLGKGRNLPPENVRYGIYLFSERGKPRYVGRVGLTERSKRAGKTFSSFRTRLRGHTRARHSEGTYAYARTVKYSGARGCRLRGLEKPIAKTQSFRKSFAANAS